jgi:hypothetical protein
VLEELDEPHAAAAIANAATRGIKRFNGSSVCRWGNHRGL